MEARGEAAFTDQAKPDQTLEQRIAELERFCGQLSLENTILKKSLATYRSKPGTFRIEDARSAHPEVSVRRLCELHGVSRSWFYQQQHREEVDPDQALLQDIEAVVEEFNGYGYRRVTRELARRGRRANHKRVLRVMRERRLLCRQRRRYRVTTDSNHQGARFPNLLREVIPVRPDQVWQADLTYVRVQRGFVYLACVLDGFTREVVGWSMSRFIDADLPLAA
ncbi:hypothetical protein DAETH_47310 (plasmid) [Deinococcus aetherius]|uniref:IS3 family transposase n=1 Tax=Deinococcus aetherius TaxID=200252 RepID=A0ABM8ALS6_9DEIO|nr:IS3 family transposase [Deinococcus aetherius]BDP44762.1 hypothetical protein DAETH_47310 [Deinococcus aetherius]